MQATSDINKWDPLTWLINDTCSEPGHKYSFSLDVTQSQPEQHSKAKPKNVTTRLFGGIIPQLWDEFI